MHKLHGGRNMRTQVGPGREKDMIQLMENELTHLQGKCDGDGKDKGKSKAKH